MAVSGSLYNTRRKSSAASAVHPTLASTARPTKKSRSNSGASLTTATKANVAADAAQRDSRRTRDVFTPPASPGESANAGAEGEGEPACYDEDREDVTMSGILEFLSRNGVNPMCSREISEGLQAERRVVLVGTTPSSAVDAAIKQHIKRNSLHGRPNIVDKVSDPKFPRKTLYQLLSGAPTVVRPLPVVTPPADSPPVFADAALPRGSLKRSVTGEAVRRRSSSDTTSNGSALELASIAYDDSFDGHDLATSSESFIVSGLSNNGQGPFAGPLHVLTDDDDDDHIGNLDSELDLMRMQSGADKISADTPVASHPASPVQELLSFKQSRCELVNIALPPSPFVCPKEADDIDATSDDDEAADPMPKVLSRLPFSLHAASRRHVHFNDFVDVQIVSPELVSLGELENLLNSSV